MKEVNNPTVDYAKELEVVDALPEPDPSDENLLREQCEGRARELSSRMLALIERRPGRPLSITEKAYYRTAAQSEPECTRAWIQNNPGGGGYHPKLALVTEEVVVAQDNRVAVFENSRRERLYLNYSPQYEGDLRGVPGDTAQQRMDVLEAASKIIELIEAVA